MVGRCLSIPGVALLCSVVWWGWALCLGGSAGCVGQCPTDRPETSFLLGWWQKKAFHFLGCLISREVARAIPAYVLMGLWVLPPCPQAFGCQGRSLGDAGSWFMPIKELRVVRAKLLTEMVLSCCTNRAQVIKSSRVSFQHVQWKDLTKPVSLFKGCMCLSWCPFVLRAAVLGVTLLAAPCVPSAAWLQPRLPAVCQPKAFTGGNSPPASSLKPRFKFSVLSHLWRMQKAFKCTGSLHGLSFW